MKHILQNPVCSCAFSKINSLKSPAKQYLFSLLICFAMYSSAQNEADKWYFGTNAGLDFSTNPPTILTNGSLNTYEGCASISDAFGNLLFYTDGITVFDKSHGMMANGNALLGNSSSTQSGIIVKKPGSSSIYYIFTQTDLAGPDGMNYSIVDMTLASGMGSVTVKNFSLYTSSCEKITAVMHCNGSDVWIVSHDYGSDIFRTFLLTSSGVSSTPVLSSVGTVISGNVVRTIGQMKVSPNGKKLGLSLYSPGALELYDFDASTGQVSNPIILLNPTDSYGCEFSADGTKFYGATFGQPTLYQWDLCAGTATAIIASKQTVTTGTTTLAGMQLAKNGKIYISTYGNSTLDVITNPNFSGAACGYSVAAQSVAPKTCGLGLPNFVNSFFRQASAPFTYTATCQNVNFEAPAQQGTVASGCSFATNSVVSMVWNFGDPNSTINNTSNLANPSHTFSAGGTYTVKLALNYACNTDTIRIPLTVSALSFTLAGFSTVCAKDVRTYTASGASSYSWSTGATTPTITLTTSVTTTYTVIAFGSGPNPCKTVQPFKVTVAKCTGIEAEDASDTFFKVFPNPSHGTLNFETDKEVKVIITNALGQIVHEKSYSAGVHNLDISSYKDGIYFVKSTSGSSSKITRLVKAE